MTKRFRVWRHEIRSSDCYYNGEIQVIAYHEKKLCGEFDTKDEALLYMFQHSSRYDSLDTAYFELEDFKVD